MKGRFAKASVAIAAAIIFNSTPLGATTSVTMDGVWWQGIPSNAKVIAVQAILAGIDIGHTAGWFDGDSYVANTYLTAQQTNARLKENFNKSMDEVNALRASAPTFSKTFGTYVDEIDVWYEAHPKSTDIGPAKLLNECFADKPELPFKYCQAGTDASK